MALNPAYAQQSTRKLPFALGYVYGSGDQFALMNAFDGTTVGGYVLGDGEWDGPHAFAPINGWPLNPIPAPTTPVSIHNPFYSVSSSWGALEAIYFHFHGGSYGTKGLPANLISCGPDQATDFYLNYFPSVTPALNLSGMAYYFVRVANQPGVVEFGIPNGGLSPVGVWRSTRCRMFDSSGNVIGYGFTTNPTWQMIETLLRFQIKPQQPGLAGLTSYERSLFDWPAMVAHAARNAAVPAGSTTGAPRFCGNFMFAADMKLGAMMETQLRNCRSFKRERAGVISFVGDDARASVFVASQKAVVPGTLKLAAKDMRNAPNIYVPQYRELNIPAVGQVATAVCTGLGVTTFTTVGSQPFFSADYFAYAGSADDADFAGDYRVGLYTDPTTGAQIAPPVANQFIGIETNGNPATAMSTTGGYLGTEQSRFKQYAPTCVQHRAAQQAFNQVSPGLTLFPRPLKVFYDLGNNTFDQTNRIMQWMMIRDLGPDVQPYQPPIVGTLSVYADNIDANGACAGEVEAGDVITLDATVDPVFAGLYVVGSPLTDNLISAGGKGGTREFALQTYQPTAFVDVSMSPGESYLTLTALNYPTADIPIANAFFVMQGTPSGGVASDGTATVILPDLEVWWVGQPTSTLYAGVQVTEVPIGPHVILYLQLSSYGGAAPVLSCNTSLAEPAVPAAVGQVVIFSGVITVSGTGGGVAIAHIAGSPLTHATMVGDAGYYGSSGITGPAAPPSY